MQNSLKFSGHETFVCKHFWPKKGIDFLHNNNFFTDDDAVVKLGVGKNMVSSIRYWLKATGLTDVNDNPTDLAKLIFNNDGFDPFVEDIGTLWLLHYHLISSEYATIYTLLFNQFFIGKTDFTKDSIHNFLKRYLSNGNSSNYNEKTINNDINVFIKNYLIVNSEMMNVNSEDDFNGLFNELNLFRKYKRRNAENQSEDYYSIERTERKDLPAEILLFVILNDSRFGSNISFNELITGHNSVGNIFLINREGVFQKIETLANKYDFISYSRTVGNIIVRVEGDHSILEILEMYYEH